MKLHMIDNGLKHRPAPSWRGKGFTLVEILVVIVIIAVLAALVFTMTKRVRISARSATCMSNVKQVGMAILMHAGDNNNKLINLGKASAGSGSISPAWPRLLATAGYLTQWDGLGNAPCGTGVWTCPESTFVSNNYGGYGVVEGTIFVSDASTPTGVSEKGSLRLSRIADPANTWLVGDAQASASDPKKGWYAIWPQPARWTNHGPAFRHGDKANVCMVDGHVESLTRYELEKRKLTEDVLAN